MEYTCRGLCQDTPHVPGMPHGTHDTHLARHIWHARRTRHTPGMVSELPRGRRSSRIQARGRSFADRAGTSEPWGSTCCTCVDTAAPYFKLQISKLAREPRESTCCTKAWTQRPLRDRCLKSRGMPAEVCAGDWQQRGCQMTSQGVRAVHLHVMDLSRCKPRPGPSPSRPGMSAVIGMQLDQPVGNRIDQRYCRSMLQELAASGLPQSTWPVFQAKACSLGARPASVSAACLASH